MHKRLILRFLILFSLVAGIVMVAPQPANADECLNECLPQFQACQASGAFGCDAVFADCMCSCRGTC